VAALAEVEARLSALAARGEGGHGDHGGGLTLNSRTLNS